MSCDRSRAGRHLTRAIQPAWPRPYSRNLAEASCAYMLAEAHPSLLCLAWVQARSPALPQPCPCPRSSAQGLRRSRLCEVLRQAQQSFLRATVAYALPQSAFVRHCLQKTRACSPWRIAVQPNGIVLTRHGFSRLSCSARGVSPLSILRGDFSSIVTTKPWVQGKSGHSEDFCHAQPRTRSATIEK